MEDSSSGPRRARPESSSSRDTRMTPTSSTNSSSAHLPRSNGARAGSGTSLLQERLRERKVESARQSRRMSVDMGGEREAQSSPVKAHMIREERRPSSSGVVAGKGMGVKQIEEQVSTLHKQNFDLKLELYHRRQRQEGLEARLEAAEKEMSEQQDVNEQLLAELEKRDQAIEEAVGVIVGLEDRVERLMQEREGVRAFDADYESGYFRESHEMSSSPPTKSSRLKVDTRAVVRMPSFLSEQSEGTEALRSLYLPHNRSHSDATLPKLSEEVNNDVPDSPRLSLLSESSFLSVYGDKRLAPDSDEAQEEVGSPPRTHRKSLSVEKWIDERPARNAAPSKSARNDGIRNNGFLSINDVLESPLQKLEKLRHTLEKHNASLTGLPERSRSLKEGERLRAENKQRPRELLHRGFTDQSSFEHYQTLPPTPDTISSSTLSHHQKSIDTLGQHSDRNGQILPSTISAFHAKNHRYNSHESTHSLRPRSAGETVTSRREGHGWDTQEELTETASQSSTASASAYAAQPQRKAIMPPNLFTFNDLDNPDEMNGWGRDMMFSTEPKLPSHKASRYDQLRRSSMVEHQRSDDTVTANNRSQYHDERGPNQYGISPIDTSPRPDLPDRRSSLSATHKLRKTNLSRSPNDPGNVTASSPITKEKPSELKKSRLVIPRLFTRSDSTPPAAFPQHTKGNGVRTLSHYDSAQREAYEEDDLARATPPPIKRNRGPGVPAYRPSSAGADTVRARRGSAFGYDGASDDIHGTGVNVEIADSTKDEVEVPSAGKSGGGQRKWLGFGRTGSLRRT
ncbi:hypothetical protein D0Z07_0763 [Hyphodiscus hymeniophilus]|uniref:Centrosomin N-terminal motif 1 domain-containing protein n=1 Tax=Hyphodiscus hymeniophilus TaxID=353542 RepID=A0A9P6VT69_9HELO|nr:hypothetical protein D0Z07_0763 [Hyphodiscus hymeniophilus]